MANNSKKEVELELDYYWQDSNASILIRVIKAQFIPFVGEDFRFNGSVELEGPPKIKCPFDSIDEWSASLTSPASTIYFSLNSSDYKKSVRFHINPGNKELRGGIEGPYEELERIKDIIQQFEKTMLLLPKSKTPLKSNQPISRRKYFTKKRLDADWLKSFFVVVRQYYGKEIHFDGKLEFETGETREVSGKDIESWTSEVISNWEMVIEVYCWLYAPEKVITFICDTRREIIDLAVQAPTKADISEIEKQMAEALDLELFTIKNPYRYRGTQGEYEILAFRNRDFGEALRLSIQQFIGPRPIVIEAYVETEVESGQEISRPLESFTEINSFLKRVEEDTSYVKVSLHVEGPRGAALGVFIGKKLTRFVINSHLNSAEHVQLVQIFKRRLRIKRIDDSKEISGAEQLKKSFADSIWFKVVFPILTLILGAVLTFVLTPSFMGAAAPVYTLKITLPSHLSDKPLWIYSENPTQTIVLEWRLETKKFFRTYSDLDAPATIRIFKDGLSEIQKIENQKPGTEIILNSGKYAIEVFSPEAQVSERFDVVITKINQ